MLEQAARQNWRVFTLAELLALGFTRDELRTMVKRRLLHQIHRGIYVYGHPVLDWRGEYLAAQYLAGEGAYLTHGSGLACTRLWRPYTREIHVTTLTDRRSRDGVVVHRTSVAPQPDELRHDGPLRWAALPRLLIEFAPVSNRAQIDRLITKSIEQSRMDHALMRTVLGRYQASRLPGVPRVTAAYAAYLPRASARSDLERRFDAALARRPWIPAPETNVVMEVGGIVCELDRLWREIGVNVEVDGRPFHEALAARDRDELKRAKLMTVGIQCLHISDWRIEYGIEDALDDLEKIIALARQRTA